MKYVIRANNYNYNDENYYIENAGKIKSIYSSREEAIKVRNELNAEAFNDYDRLNDFVFNAEHMDEKCAWLRKYYKDNFDIELNEEDEYLEEDLYLPDNVTDEQVTTILDNLGISFFQVYEHDSFSPLVELQLNPEFWGEEAYIITEPANRSFYFSEAEGLQYLIDSINNELYETPPGMKGSLEELSNTPEILKAFLDKSEALMYSEGEAGIAFKENKYEVTIDEFTALANLLKVKPYEVALFSLQDAVELSEQPVKRSTTTAAPASTITSPQTPVKKWWQFWK